MRIKTKKFIKLRKFKNLIKKIKLKKNRIIQLKKLKNPILFGFGSKILKPNEPDQTGSTSS